MWPCPAAAIAVAEVNAMRRQKVEVMNIQSARCSFCILCTPKPGHNAGDGLRAVYWALNKNAVQEEKNGWTLLGLGSLFVIGGAFQIRIPFCRVTLI